MSATTQAQRAIDALLSAGFERSEFSVRTERIYRGTDNDGKKIYELGSANITLKCNKKRQVDMTQAMVDAGLHVIHLMSNGNTSVLIKNSRKEQGWLEIRDLNEVKAQIEALAQDDEPEAPKAEEKPSSGKVDLDAISKCMDATAKRVTGNPNATVPTPKAKKTASKPKADAVTMTVRFPDGTEATRNSKRCYSHAVIGQGSDGTWVVVQWNGNEKKAATAFKYFGNTENKDPKAGKFSNLAIVTVDCK